MKTRAFDVVVIGAGPAGLAAALKAAEGGASVVVLERDSTPGGILNQCIHSGFGLTYFHEELTGPEYAQLFADKVAQANIDCHYGSMVLNVSPDKTVDVMNENGMVQYKAGAVVLAMGCRERTRGAVKIPGDRPAGVFTAGTAQRYMNIENLKPGNRAVILGSGDIGLIMARRLTLEGIEVAGVYELMPYANGLYRNIKNCLEDFDIPLHLSSTVTRINGQGRVESVEISKVDQNLKPIPGTQQTVACDTVLLSVGLIPENELTRKAGIGMDPITGGPCVNEALETNVPGIFACGNVLHVHDLVDQVTAEAEAAGSNAADYALGRLTPEDDTYIPVVPEGAVRYTVPECIHAGTKGPVPVKFRVGRPIENAVVTVYAGEKLLYRSRKPADLEPSIMQRVFVKDVPQSGQITVKAFVEEEV